MTVHTEPDVKTLLQTDAEIVERLQNLYRSFNNEIKIMMVQIEAESQKFPLGILNEIRDLNDHISRCYSHPNDRDYIISQLRKAEGHKARIILDCYKYLIMLYEDQIKFFEKQTRWIDLTSISNGDFYKKYVELRQIARKSFQTAKISETAKDSNRYDLYQKAIDNYLILLEHIDLNMKYVNPVRHKWVLQKVGAFLFWVISIVVSSILSNNNQQIVAVFKGFFH